MTGEWLQPWTIRRLEVFSDLVGRNGRSGFTSNARGHAHQKLTFGQTVCPQNSSRCIEHIDPAGRNVSAGRIDFAITLALDLTDADKAAVFDSNIRRDPGISRAVKHAAVSNYDVVPWDVSLGCGNWCQHVPS